MIKYTVIKHDITKHLENQCDDASDLNKLTYSLK